MSDFKAKCTKFNFGWSSILDPAGGAYSAPPDHLAGFKGPTSKGREEKGVSERRVPSTFSLWIYTHGPYTIVRLLASTLQKRRQKSADKRT